MSGLRQVLQRTVKGAAALHDRVRPPHAGIVVLAYHRVGGDSGLDVDLPVAEFEDQMGWLAATRRVISLDDAATALLQDDDGSGGAVVVTFDDGTADFADRAMPVLDLHRIPVTLFLATRFVEERVDFPDAGTPLSWSGLADTLATGLVTVGSHTHSHALMDRADHATAAAEVDRSIALIGDRLAVGCDHFAYPKGQPGSPGAEHAIRRRFTTASLGGTRPNVPSATDLHRLARSPVQVSDGRHGFERKVDGGMALEDTLRRLLNRRRYAGATT